jgi:hypothetical protein
VSAILPLFLMWLARDRSQSSASKKQSRRRGKVKKAKPPSWPTPKSPPPMPAFQPAPPAPPPASADPSGSSTPLAALHTAPPKLSPASLVEPAKQKAMAAAKSAAKKQASSLLQRGLSFGFGKSAPNVPTSTALVSQLQSILNRRGAKLAQDGLYGPKTATAWGDAARAQNLPTLISREGPKIAKVATQTFEALSAAPIP